MGDATTPGPARPGLPALTKERRNPWPRGHGPPSRLVCQSQLPRSTTTSRHRCDLVVRGGVHHPHAGVALTRGLAEARQRLADMLVVCDQAAPATADIIAFHPTRLVESYRGTAGDIFTQVNAAAPGRTVIAHPLTGNGPE